MSESTIFNTKKTAAEYKEGATLLFGSDPGLFDTVNKKFPKIWDLYKEMKSLDWDEGEFDYSQCLIEFKTGDDAAEMMIETLAYQWEADSVASRCIAPVMAPFVTNSELWAAYQRISDNEVIHAATYSEIIRLSFEDPSEVMDKILAVKHAMTRMETVNKVFAEAFVASHEYALGIRPYSQELYNLVYKFIATVFIMERVQFMASFGITFTITGGGRFQPVEMAVKKIAQDELEVHVELGREVLRIEGQTDRGRIAAEATKGELTRILHEVIQSEFDNLEHIFRDGRKLLGTNIQKCREWVLFNAKDPLVTLGLESDLKFPAENPMRHLESRLNMNKSQSAPQEQDNAAYKVGVVFNDDDGEIFPVDF